jgi:hypothetical protein
VRVLRSIFVNLDVKEQLLIFGTVVVFTVINNILVDLVVDHEPPLDKVIFYGALALGVLINGSLLTVAQVAMQRRRSRLAEGMPDDAGKVLGWSWALALFGVAAVAVLLLTIF